MQFRLEYNGEPIGKGPLESGNYRLGRGNNEWVFIKGQGLRDGGEAVGEATDASISRIKNDGSAHLEMTASDGCLRLSDVSRYGTYVNDRRIQTHGITRPGRDRVRLGDTFTFDIVSSE